jgi:hypothetical protein
MDAIVRSFARNDSGRRTFTGQEQLGAAEPVGQPNENEPGESLNDGNGLQAEVYQYTWMDDPSLVADLLYGVLCEDQ